MLEEKTVIVEVGESQPGRNLGKRFIFASNFTVFLDIEFTCFETIIFAIVLRTILKWGWGKIGFSAFF